MRTNNICAVRGIGPMKIPASLLVLTVISLTTVPWCPAYEPVLTAPVKIQASGADLDVGSYAIPRACDWDNDLRKDLIIGQRTDGKVRLYLNTGTDETPVFTTFSYIQANGSDISVYGSGCQGAAPEIVDWNSDGMKDLLVGDANGYVFLYLNEGSDASPVLGAGSNVEVGGSSYKADARAVPTINDWNEDTKKDLLVGRGDGEISVLLNDNTDADPVFNIDDRVYADLMPLDGGFRVAPRIFDWNGDGYKDIVAGEAYGLVLFYENIRTNDDPDFDSTKVYLEAGGSQIDVGYRSRPEVSDWNNDGLPDLLVGADNGCVYLIEQQFIFAFESISYDSSTGTTLVWRSREGDTYTVYDSTDMILWNVAEAGVASQGFTTTWTDSTSPSSGERYYKIGVSE
jgi:hypothetical protein